MDYSNNETLNNYKNVVEDKIAIIAKSSRPSSLYDPVRHAVGGGGKRLRPVIVLAACEAAGGNPEDAIDAAVAVELLHTFTLVHDDIMDKDTLRRGRETVHKKWNSSAAILAGDAILVLAYQSLMRTKGDKIKNIVNVFNDGILGVCEGQALDIELEQKEEVSNLEYMEMIEKKTGMMIAMAAGIGAIIGGAETDDVEKFKAFGLELGNAFQLQDDYLEITSTKSKMGKSLGSDLVKGKKTFLLINALKLANTEQNKELSAILNKEDILRVDLIRVGEIFQEIGVFDLTRKLIEKSIAIALSNLEFIDLDARKNLVEITGMVESRES